MFNHRFDEIPSNKVILHWFLFCFNGGFINAGGFLATGRFVSHVTGFATLFGVDIMGGEVQTAIGILSVPIFFLLGAFIAGLLIDRPVYEGKTPHFDWVMGLSGLCLFSAAIVGSGKPVFQSLVLTVGLQQSYILLALLCLASGLQNAAITSSSGSSVRTTHLTGLTTDLGLGLARIFTFNLQAEKLKKEIKVNRLRVGSIISFVVGSAVGAGIFIHLGYRGFLVSGVIAFYGAWHGKRAKVALHPLNRR